MSTLIMATIFLCHNSGPLPPKAVEFVVVTSYYGRECHGHPMAFGGRFNEKDPKLAAHKTLPPKTRLEVRRPRKEDAPLIEAFKKARPDVLNLLPADDEPQEERSDVVLVIEICDRGPFIDGRDLDVSEAGAKTIGFEEEGVAILIAKVVDEQA